MQDDSETIITDAKYGFISGAIKETYKEGIVSRRKKTDIIDTFLTHKLFGFPLFFAFLWLMFQSTFTIGKYPMDWIEHTVEFISNIIHNHMPDGMLKDLIIDGIIGGVGGVIVFLPNILILFLFISIMEDTGYMARVAFIMDKLMHKIGLHGKSFIPLLMGFGCNVPAIMSTRTVENRSDRLLTMLINPFMSCSARLPVYLVIIGAIFADKAGFILFTIYCVGVLIAITMAILLKNTIFRSVEVPFVMELPPYRIPTVKSILLHMWHKAQQYLQKMGGIILIASILIWALGYFPRDENFDAKYKAQLSKINDNFEMKQKSLQSDSLKINKLIVEKDSLIKNIESSLESERQSNSFIGRLGHGVEPVLRPLGFDWKMGVSLIAGIAGKEIVVSTMGVLYQAGSNADEKGETLKTRIKNETYISGEKIGQKVFTQKSSFSFLLFILIYFPCIASVTAIKRESGKWKWAIFTMVYTTSIAWLVSFVFYQVASLF